MRRPRKKELVKKAKLRTPDHFVASMNRLDTCARCGQLFRAHRNGVCPLPNPFMEIKNGPNT
jgi:ribosomal protein L32